MSNDPRRLTPMGREIDLQLIAAKIGQQFAEQIRQYTKCCITCQHWQEKQEVCGLHNYQRPPAPIIAFGCLTYVEAPPF